MKNIASAKSISKNTGGNDNPKITITGSKLMDISLDSYHKGSDAQQPSYYLLILTLARVFDSKFSTIPAHFERKISKGCAEG
ncbi:hypothetical protein [Serratia sp. M24T3]|uniref:Uncharacterized protein n=1 Tax=Rouxiella sp. WC2420 TaxID=3234145 RepID=A0AB39VXU6_9GAMM|nr:hypothetical protein [Serratia sp. M24T3]